MASGDEDTRETRSKTGLSLSAGATNLASRLKEKKPDPTRQNLSGQGRQNLPGQAGPGSDPALKAIRFRLPGSLFPAVLSIALLLLAWEVSSRSLGLKLIFPGPVATLESTWTLLAEPGFWVGVWSSLVRVVISFGLGLVICLPLGLLMGRHSFAWSFFQVWQVIFRSAPVISVILLALMWFPDPGNVAVFVSFLMVFPILLAAIAQGRRSLDVHLDEMTRVYCFSPSRRFFWLILPWLRPFLLSSGKTALGIAWKVVAAAEVLAQPRYGIGTMMQDGRINLETSRVFALTLAIILLSALGDLVWEGLFRLLGAPPEPGKARGSDQALAAATGQDPDLSAIPDGQEHAGHGMENALPAAPLAVPDRVPAKPVSPGPDRPGPVRAELAGSGPVRLGHGGPGATDPGPAGFLLELKDVQWSWPGGPALFHDFSLAFVPGTVSVLMGPSGKGKTTLARLMLGLEQVRQGRVETAPGLVMAPVFQEHRLLPWARVDKNALLAHPGRIQDRKLLEHLADVLEIRDSLDALPSTLSGGMRQRAALLRSLYRGAMASGGVLYLWDEPFQSLDPALKARLLPELAPVLAASGNAALIITHQAEDARLFGREVRPVSL